MRQKHSGENRLRLTPEHVLHYSAAHYVRLKDSYVAGAASSGAEGFESRGGSER